MVYIRDLGSCICLFLSVCVMKNRVDNGDW